jgi:hypothetical protein
MISLLPRTIQFSKFKPPISNKKKKILTISRFTSLPFPLWMECLYEISIECQRVSE